MEVAKDFLSPEVNAAFAGITVREFDDGDSLLHRLRPEGRAHKKRSESASAHPPRPTRRAPAALWPMRARPLRRPQDGCRCPLPCAERKSSTARPTNTAAPERRD